MDQINQLIELWQSFMNSEFSTEALVAGGGVMVVFGIVRIIKSSFKLVLYVLMVIIGGCAMAYANQHATFKLPNNLQASIGSLALPGRDLSVDALRTMCEKVSLLDEAGQLQ